MKLLSLAGRKQGRMWSAPPSRASRHLAPDEFLVYKEEVPIVGRGA